MIWVNNKRKIWLALGAGITTVAPVAAVVACTESNTLKPWKFEIADDAVIMDISKMSSEDLINKILETIGTRMDKSIVEIDPSNAERYDDVKAYLSKANFSKEIIRLKMGNEQFDLNFKYVHKNISELKEIANKYKYSELNQSKALSIGMSADGIQGISYTKVMLSMSEAMKIKDFMCMYEPSYNPQREVNDEELKDTWMGYQKGDKVDDTDALIANHPYLNLLKAYHNVFYYFTKSNLYKEWSKDKTFIVAENNSPSIIVGTHQENGVKKIVKTGELYDLPDSIKGLPETSNLEFSFFYSLVGLK